MKKTQHKSYHELSKYFTKSILKLMLNLNDITYKSSFKKTELIQLLDIHHLKVKYLCLKGDYHFNHYDWGIIVPFFLQVDEIHFEPSIKSRIFKRDNEITQIDLKYLPITKFPSLSASTFNSLKKLDLTGTNVEYLPPSVYKIMPYLEELKMGRLGENILKFKHGNLIGINFYDTNIQRIPGEAFEVLASLKYLYLGGVSPLKKKIKEAYVALSYTNRLIHNESGTLKGLDLRGSVFEGVCDTLFDYIPLIEQLYLGDDSYNRIQVENGNLVELNFNALHLKTVPSSIRSLQYLKIIDFSRNQIRNIPDWFKELALVQTLDFEYNKLEVVPEFLFEFSMLNLINLANNKLRTIPPSFFRRKLFMAYLFPNSLLDLSRQEKAKIKKIYGKLETITSHSKNLTILNF